MPPDVVAAIAAAVAAIAPRPQPLPRPRVHRPARGARGIPHGPTTGVGVAPEQVWAGNGSNEVLQHLVQAFGGPGRIALGFTPAYSMHPIISRTDRHDLGRRAARAGRPAPSTSTPSRPSRRCASTSRTSSSSARPTTRPAPRCALDVVEAVVRRGAERAIVVVDEAYAEFARPGTPSALTLLEGRPRLVVTRTMSKAFALRRRPARLPRRRPRARRRAAPGPAALPPVGARPRRSPLAALAARRQHARHRRGHQGAARPDRRASSPSSATRRSPSDANFVLFGGLADAGATWRGLLDRGRPGPRRRHPPPPAGHGGHPAETDAFLTPWPICQTRTGSTHATRSSRHEPGMTRTGEPAEPGDVASRASSWSSTSTAPATSDISTGVRFYDHMLASLGQALAHRPDASRPPATSTSTRTTPSRTSRSCSATRCARRSATSAASPGSATPRCRSTRRSSRPSSTWPGRPYVVHTGEPEGQRTSSSAATTRAR